MANVTLNVTDGKGQATGSVEAPAELFGHTADEVAAILAVFDEWGERDRSHRRLAHRGSYVGRFWASPSTVRRILIESDKHFRPIPQPAKGGGCQLVCVRDGVLSQKEIRL